MEIKRRRVDDIMILDISGEIIIGKGDVILRKEINDLVMEGEVWILLNLQRVPFIDSAGIGQIVACHTTVTRAGGDLKLLNLSKKIRELLTITKLIMVLDTYSDFDEAILSFKDQNA